MFKLAAMLPNESSYVLTSNIKKQLIEFVEVIEKELPDKQIFKDMGFPSLTAERIIEQIKKSFSFYE